MTRQLNTTNELSIICKDRFVPWSWQLRSISLPTPPSANSALVSPSPNTWPFLEQIPMDSLFKSTLPSDNNDTTTIVFDWRDKVVVGWLKARLGWNRCTFCLRRRLLLRRYIALNWSEWNLQRLVKALWFQWSNVRRIELHMITTDIIGMHKVILL